MYCVTEKRTPHLPVHFRRYLIWSLERQVNIIHIHFYIELICISHVFVDHERWKGKIACIYTCMLNDLILPLYLLLLLIIFVIFGSVHFMSLYNGGLKKLADSIGTHLQSYSFQKKFLDMSTWLSVVIGYHLVFFHRDHGLKLRMCGVHAVESLTSDCLSVRLHSLYGRYQYLSCSMTKQTKWCAPSQISLRCPHEEALVLSYP